MEGELACERAAKAKLEDETKRAFMRGVCALNIEVRRQGELPHGGGGYLLVCVVQSAGALFIVQQDVFGCRFTWTLLGCITLIL